MCIFSIIYLGDSLVCSKFSLGWVSALSSPHSLVCSKLSRGRVSALSLQQSPVSGKALSSSLVVPDADSSAVIYIINVSFI